MTTYLKIDQAELKAANGYWTAREIAQQPAIWSEVCENISKIRTDIDHWLGKILAQEELRIILTGAGTSAYVGEALAPFLSKALKRPVEAISTTDLVSNPDHYLLRNKPTLLISFARSGNSPESLAACQLADQLIENCFHLIITCNKDGALAKQGERADNYFTLLMPEATLDQSFAMTSSFSSMLLSTLWIFAPDDQQLVRAIELSEYILDTHLEAIENIANLPFRRAVFLGCGGLLGIATEANLKMLELTAGEIDCYYESPLGFRHGPKLIVEKDTLIILLNSGDQHRKKYEQDLVGELKRDGQTRHLIEMNDFLNLSGLEIDDVWLSMPYILFCQLLAFYKSLSLEKTPDNPCPTGEANRVVQGVTIYPFEE